MWDELVSMRRMISLMDLLPLVPEFKGLDGDSERVKAYYGSIVDSGAEGEVSLNIGELGTILSPMVEWLERLTHVASERGTDSAVCRVYKLMHGPGGFEQVLSEIGKIRWSSRDDTVKLSATALEMMRVFNKRARNPRRDVINALKANFLVRAGQYPYGWIYEIVDIGKGIEENVTVVREEAAKRNIVMDGFDAIFAMQTNGIILATKDEFPASLASSYLSAEYDIEELIIKTDTGKALGAKVTLADEAKDAHHDNGAGSAQEQRPIIIWQEYTSQDLRGELFDSIFFLRGTPMLVSHRGIVAYIEDTGYAQDFRSFKIQCLGHREATDVAAKHLEKFHEVPCLLYEPPSKPMRAIVADKSIVEEFFCGMFPRDDDVTFRKFSGHLESSNEDVYSISMESSTAAAAELWGKYSAYSEQIMQGWKGLSIMHESHARRQHILTTVQRLFLSRLGGFINRNGKMKCSLDNRNYVISFYQKRYTGGAVKACALWSEQSNSFTQIENFIELPGLMGMSWKDGLSLVRFLMIAKHRAMLHGCVINVEDGIVGQKEWARFAEVEEAQGKRITPV